MLPCAEHAKEENQVDLVINAASLLELDSDSMSVQKKGLRREWEGIGQSLFSLPSCIPITSFHPFQSSTSLNPPLLSDPQQSTTPCFSPLHWLESFHFTQSIGTDRNTPVFCPALFFPFLKNGGHSEAIGRVDGSWSWRRAASQRDYGSGCTSSR